MNQMFLERNPAKGISCSFRAIRYPQGSVQLGGSATLLRDSSYATSNYVPECWARAISSIYLPCRQPRQISTDYESLLSASISMVATKTRMKLELLDKRVAKRWRNICPKYDKTRLSRSVTLLQDRSRCTINGVTPSSKTLYLLA